MCLILNNGAQARFTNVQKQAPVNVGPETDDTNAQNTANVVLWVWIRLISVINYSSNVVLQVWIRLISVMIYSSNVALQVWIRLISVIIIIIIIIIIKKRLAVQG